MDPQVLLNGIIAGSAYGLVALSFAILYRLGKFFDLTPAIGCVAGAYAALLFTDWLRWPAQYALLIGIVASASLGIAVHLVLYRSLLLKRSGPSEKFLASLGFVVVAQSAIAIGFGEDTKVLHWASQSPIRFLGLSLTEPQLWILSVAVGLWGLTIFAERFSRAGRYYRAVAGDEELARSVGISVDVVRTVAAGSSSVIAGLNGILVGTDIGLSPGMGFRAILMGVVAAVIGGIGSLEGVMLGAIFIGVIQHLVAWWISSVWQDATVFVILILSLLVRPKGFLGKPLKRASV